MPTTAEEPAKAPMTTSASRAAIRRYVGLAVVGAIVGGAIALLVDSFLPVVYTANSQVILGNPNDLSIFRNTAVTNTSSLALAAAQTLRSDQVAQRSSQLLHGALSPTDVQDDSSVTPADKSPVVTVTATAPTARGARNLANAIGQAYLDVQNGRYKARADQAVKTLTALRDSQQTQLTDVQNQMAAKVQAATQQAADLQPGDRNAFVQGLLQTDASYQALQTQATSLQSSLGDVDNTLQQTSADYSMLQSGVDSVQPADLPQSRTSPATKRNLAIGAVVGALLGLAVAWRLTERGRVLNPDLASAALGAPVLARLGHDRHLRRLGDVGSHTSPAVRELSVLATSVVLAAERSGSHVAVVTSAHAREGKSMVASNVARLGAASGRSIVLIDAAGGDGGLTEAFGMEGRPGLSEIASGTVPPEEATVNHGERTRLPVVPSGRQSLREALNGRSRVPAAPEPWTPERFEKARLPSTLVIVDSPPVNADPIALEIARTGFLLVVASPHTTLEDLEVMRNRAELSGVEILGLVLNEHRARRSRRPPRSSSAEPVVTVEDSAAAEDRTVAGKPAREASDLEPRRA